MKLLTRPRLTAEEIAAARSAEVRADVDRARQLDALQRERAAADRAEERRAERDRARAEKRRRKALAKARAQRRARRRALASVVRTVGPLLLVNLAAIGGQAAYGFTRTPAAWPVLARLLVAVVYAATVESISLYVNWHAHDALLNDSPSTAAAMRRRAYGIAAVVAVVNYSHFDDEGWTPTPFAVGSGMASLLSPWLWGLHTRRAHDMQLLRQELRDETGATFDRRRKRAFPVRTWRAQRWSIEHSVRDPREAWTGYHAERAARLAALPGGRLRTALAVLRGLDLRAQAAPAEPTPEPVSLDDPDIQACAEVRERMRGIRDRYGAGAARIAAADRDPRRWIDLRAGGLWDLVDATHEPAHVRRPAPAAHPAPVEAAQHCAQTDAPDARTGAQRVDAPPLPGLDDAPGGDGRPPVSPRTAARLAEAYDRFVAEHGRAPLGRDLAKATGVHVATANRWKRAAGPK
ncbi:hypothetical protein [Micromonospora inyonensis]|uniref:DUF2637 domain-containing protein n=1 Tax=Micromonospora inyonensis TaxID=47866 RepID=A0A1C6RDI7_9ACTN|nr:hypothetical protein [Micromonospora inyonensis]SCL15023.1 hypothetical protein GA0074694_1019 [Micromonospora inyonensis]